MNRTRAGALCGSAVLALSLLTGCGSAGPTPEVVNYHGAFPSYSTSADLLKDADLVIRGVAVKSRVERTYPQAGTGTDPEANPQAGLSDAEVEQWRQQSAVVVTVSTVRVEEAIKGGAKKDDLVEVVQLGGEFEKVKYQNPETTLLSQGGTDYVLFLAAHDDKPYDLLNPQQALYVVGPNSSLKPATGSGLRGVTDVEALRKAAAGR